MSRLATLSSAALAAMFSSDADDSLIALLTFSGDGIATPKRIANGYTGRLSETADEVVYGVTSRSNEFIYLPLEITLPDEAQGQSPECSLTLHDVTRYLIPTIRSLSAPPDVLVELVLSSTPDTVEMSFTGFSLTNISYNRDAITGRLSIESTAVEPFPQHTFTPSCFPGLF